MAEGTTIRADQIEGLPDLILEKVREVLREEVKPAPEDMDQLRRSPAGTMIRLEEQVKALDEKVDRRFDSLKSEMDQRFDSLKSEMGQRFVAVDQKIETLRSEVDRRFSLLQWAVGLMYPILLAILGKLFLIK